VDLKIEKQTSRAPQPRELLALFERTPALMIEHRDRIFPRGKCSDANAYH